MDVWWCGGMEAPSLHASIPSMPYCVGRALRDACGPGPFAREANEHMKGAAICELVGSNADLTPIARAEKCPSLSLQGALGEMRGTGISTGSVESDPHY